MEMSVNISERSVLFITLDSCRYDSFLHANTPTFDRLGKLKPAGTHGTYTFPAHMSFFMGYLPSVVIPPYEPFYTAEVSQLWRMASGRARDPKTVGITLDGLTLPRSYSQKGYKVIGAGGVRWFRHPLLTEQFDQFFFYGRSDYSSVFNERGNDEFALTHRDELIKEIGNNNFFLFINCHETHVPYNSGSEPLSEKTKEILKKYEKIWGCKKAFADEMSIDSKDMEILHKLQIKAVEDIDRKVGDLLEKIRKPLLVVITGDHGECFGENNAWGHGYPHEKVMEVPLIISTVN